MSTQEIATREKSEVEFVPFGGEDKIKLSLAIVRNFVANPTKSGAMPQDRDCMKFLMLCRSRRLNPFEGDAFLIGYDGKDGPQFSLITAHQAFLKRAENHPEFDGMTSGVIVETEDRQLIDRVGDFYLEGEKVVGAWATVHFKTRKHPMEKRLRLKTFQKPFGVWQTDPGGMIVKCAEADALRSSFPTMLGGMYLRDEIESNVTEIPKEEPRRPIFGQPVKQQINGPFPTYQPEDQIPGAEVPNKPRRGRPPKAQPQPESPEESETALPPSDAAPVPECPSSPVPAAASDTLMPRQRFENMIAQAGYGFEEARAALVVIYPAIEAKAELWTGFGDIQNSTASLALANREAVIAQIEAMKEQ